MTCLIKSEEEENMSCQRKKCNYFETERVWSPNSVYLKKLGEFWYNWSVKVYVGGEADLYATIGTGLLENLGAILRCFKT